MQRSGRVGRCVYLLFIIYICEPDLCFVDLYGIKDVESSNGTFMNGM